MTSRFPSEDVETYIENFHYIVKSASENEQLEKDKLEEFFLAGLLLLLLLAVFPGTLIRFVGSASNSEEGGTFVLGLRGCPSSAIGE